MKLSYLLLMVALIAVAAVLVWPPAGPSAPTVDLVVMTTSDLNGRIEPYPNETGCMVGGLSRIAAASGERPSFPPARSPTGT